MLRDLVCFSITSVIGFHGNIERWGISQLVISLLNLLDVSKYAKHLHKYVCFHYKYHLSQLIYLINAENHQIS